jgi:hypothetical protein
MITDSIGGRKFVYAVLAVALSFALVILGKLSADSWTTFVSIIGGIYVAGNVADQFISGNTPTPPTPATPAQS